MRNSEKKLKIIFSVLTTVLFVLTVVYMFTIWNLRAHSDMTAANILAREQMRTGQLFPETWNTSSALFIVFFNLLMIPLSLFIENQLLLRNLAVLIWLCVFLILLWYLSKKYLRSNCYLIFLCFFFSGTSDMVLDMGFVQAAYLPGLLESILLLVLALKAFDDNFAIKSKKWLICFMLFIGYLSLYGVTNMAYQVIPLLGAIVLYILLENQDRSYESLKPQILTWLKTISLTLLSVIVGLVGYKAIAAHTGFQSIADITYPESSNLADRFVQFVLFAIGYRTNVMLFSLEGLMNAVILFGFIAVIVCCILLFARYHEQSFPVKILMLFGLFVNAIHLYFIFVCYSFYIGNNRYLFRPMMFLWFLAAYYIYTYVLSREFLVKNLAIVAVAVFSLPYMLASIPQVAQYPQGRVNQMGLVNFLKEHNLKHGYATFWNAGKNMVLSDFDIEIGGVNLEDTIRPYYWLSSDTSYDPNAYEGESFLLLTESENTQYAASRGMYLLGKPQEVLTYPGYVIYTYPYNISSNNFYGIDYSDREVLGLAVVSDEAMRNEDGTLTLPPGQVIFGPYIPLPVGKYEIRVEFSELDGPASLILTSDSGQRTWLTESVHENVQTIHFETAEDLWQFEVVFRTDTHAVLNSVKITQVY